MRLRSLAVLILVLAACDSASDTAPDTTPDVIADVASGDTTPQADADATGPELPPPELWPSSALPSLEGGFHERHTALQPWSHWHTHVVAGEEVSPAFRGRGAFALGNGHVFAIVGLGEPANAIHGMAGPDYEQRESFFGDIAIGVEGDERTWLDYDEQWVLGSLGGPALLWRGTRDELVVETVDVLPDASATDGVTGLTWFRTVLVRNEGDSNLDGLSVVVVANRSNAADDGVSLEEDREGRRRVTYTDRDGATAEGHRITIPLPSIAPGAEERLTLFLTTHALGDNDGPERSAALATDVDAMIDAAAAAMTAWWDEILSLETPDPVFDDAVRGLALNQRYQITATGATSAMSRYAGTWTRDNTGPVLALLALGAHDLAQGVIDYYWCAVLDAGGIQNTYPSNLDCSAPLPREPDWESLGTGEGREKGEAPSYIPLMYSWVADWTGRTAEADARMGMLYFALDIQQMWENGLLTWSDDETFRAAMNLAMGIPFEFPHGQKTWSTNSSLLYVAAARGVARIHDALGQTEAAATMRERADAADTAALDLLRAEDGCWLSYRFRDTNEPSPGPFEDVALKELWVETRDGDDADAQARLQCLVDHVSRAPGMLVSTLPPQSQGVLPFVYDGIYTGMLPGYALSALTRGGHPDAEAALEAVRVSLDPAGNCTEYMAYDDHLPLQALYLPDGSGMTDYTARYRPWEGGIVLHALLEYVVGVRPRALEDGAFALRPHLPNDWPSFRAQRVRVGGTVFAEEVVRSDVDAVTIRLTATAMDAESVPLTVRWDHADDEAPAVTVNGEAADPSAVVLRSHLGAASTEVQGLTLSMDAPLEVTFTGVE